MILILIFVLTTAGFFGFFKSALENCADETILMIHVTPATQWKKVNKSESDLSNDAAKISKIKKTSKELPALLIHELKRANDISLAMKLRGYGKLFPRGVTYPIPFNWNHGVMILVITITYYALHNYVTI